MDWFIDLLHNSLFINALIAWAIAQVLKTVIFAIVNKTIDFSRMVGDGGMPSCHSATVAALAVTAALDFGISSAEFAISAILAIIVMHDAMGVRREAGKQAKALNEVLRMLSENGNPDVVLKELLGHTPLQVGAGMVIGIAVAFLLH